MLRRIKFSIALLLLGPLAGCAILGIQAIRGSGIAVSEQREAPSFQQLSVSGAIDVLVESGDFQSIMIDGDDNLVPLIRTTVKGDRLHIGPEGMVNFRPKVPLRVTVVCPTLSYLGVSGASDVEVRELAADRFEVNVSGASELNVSGACNQLVANVSGASDVDLRELAAITADVDVSGAADVDVIAIETLTGDASGASDLRYGGTARAKVSSSGGRQCSAAELVNGF